jgi:acetyl-CoA C-acetyltransferase
MENVVIVSGVRTPIGAYGGTLCSMHVSEFTAIILNEAINRAKIDPEHVDDVIMGQAYQNGECANGARMALLEAG